jgi:hypothetical protein
VGSASTALLVQAHFLPLISLSFSSITRTLFKKISRRWQNRGVEAIKISTGCIAASPAANDIPSRDGDRDVFSIDLKDSIVFYNFVEMAQDF